MKIKANEVVVFTERDQFGDIFVKSLYVATADYDGPSETYVELEAKGVLKRCSGYSVFWDVISKQEASIAPIRIDESEREKLEDSIVASNILQERISELERAEKGRAEISQRDNQHV